MNKELLFSVTKKDLRIDYYRGEGKGGQKKNKTENCCRITHEASGAVGKSEEGRSKEYNKKNAFKRMIATEEFKKWQKLEVSKKLGFQQKIEEAVEKALQSSNLKTEGKDDNGRWTELKENNEDNSSPGGCVLRFRKYRGDDTCV